MTTDAAVVPTSLPDAGCMAQVEQPPLLAPIHVPIGTDIMWDSNPPSSGEHFHFLGRVSDALREPRPPWLLHAHNAEHGAIVSSLQLRQRGVS